MTSLQVSQQEQLLILGVQHLAQRLAQQAADLQQLLHTPQSAVVVTGNSSLLKAGGIAADKMISRIINGGTQWDEVLDCAVNPYLRVIIFNSSRVPDNILNDRIRARVPHSYAGKLLAILYKRYQYFGHTTDSGLGIIALGEPDDATRLEAILLELAHRNGLETMFLDWLENANKFG